MAEFVGPCECKDGMPTTHKLYKISIGVGKVWERIFVCTSCGRHNAPPPKNSLAAAHVDG